MIDSTIFLIKKKYIFMEFWILMEELSIKMKIEVFEAFVLTSGRP